MLVLQITVPLLSSPISSLSPLHPVTPSVYHSTPASTLIHHRRRHVTASHPVEGVDEEGPVDSAEEEEKKE